MNSIFTINHFKFFDKAVLNKRKEMVNIINKSLENVEIVDALDIGSTNDQIFESSNFLIQQSFLIPLQIFHFLHLQQFY